MAGFSRTSPVALIVAVGAFEIVTSHDAEAAGEIRMNVDAGKVAWHFKTDQPLIGGVLVFNSLLAFALP
ncbi:hypothetical protein NOV72_02169 [Caballeronia novacaledonica]|uniref:Uncharacterized protein n=2 Tax=Caballeronia novacaledonica TaxID=1544861 RepID=A0A2U3I465_9BURK|nr:hypothetical protein NOV72_02169 [Caballeronia novacaledonica]